MIPHEPEGQLPVASDHAIEGDVCTCGAQFLNAAGLVDAYGGTGTRPQAGTSADGLADLAPQAELLL